MGGFVVVENFSTPANNGIFTFKKCSIIVGGIDKFDFLLDCFITWVFYGIP